MLCAMLIWLFSSAVTGAVISWFLFLLGLGLIIFGSFGRDRDQSDKTWRERISQRFPEVLSFPLLLFISPFLVILTKFFHILRPKNKFIENQKKCATISESVLEALPQFGLQFFIILLRFQ